MTTTPLRRFVVLAAVSIALASAAPALAVDAGTIHGTVADVPGHGKFFHVTVERTEPEGVASPGDRVKIMANWARTDGKLGPKPDDVERILGHRVGQAVEVAVRRDKKQPEAFRFTPPQRVEQITRQAERVEATMVLPDEPMATDASRITGAELDKLARMEAAITETIAVAPGDDLVAALRRAASLIDNGKAVRVRLAPGRFTVDSGRQVKFNEGVDKSPLLVVEGAGPDRTVIAFTGSGKPKALIYMNKRHHTVFRGFAMTGHPKTPIEIGRYAPIQDNANLLIEDCLFEKCENGLVIFHADRVTIRGVVSRDHDRSGAFLIVTNAIIEDSAFTGNLGKGRGSFRGGIALAAADTLIRRVRCDDNAGRGSGIRMDHAANNVVIEDSTFNRNGRAGMVWETALGPVTVRRSELIGNRQSGVELATAYHFAFEDTTIADNGDVQVLIVAKPRPVIFEARGNKSGAYGAADLYAGVGEQWTNLKGMMANRHLRVENCVIGGGAGSGPFYAHKYGKPGLYQELFTDLFVASNNTYVHPETDVLFDTFRGGYNDLALVGLEEWKAWTGQESGSRHVKRLDAVD